MVQPLWKTVQRFLEKLKIELPYDPAIPLLGINPKKTKTLIRKDTVVANKHRNRCSISLIMREIQIKTTMSYHFTPVRMATIKKQQIINVGKDVEIREP